MALTQARTRACGLRRTFARRRVPRPFSVLVTTSTAITPSSPRHKKRRRQDQRCRCEDPRSRLRKLGRKH
eukprot:1906802-Pleurochrysis_carterae.AAC.5